MQTAKDLINVVALLGLLIGASSLADEFSDAIAKEKALGADMVQTVGKGLPYYTSGSLNPTWDLKQEPIAQVSRLRLTDQDNKTRGSEVFSNKISLVTFIFTSCRGFCPMLVKNMLKVQSTLKSRNNVQFVAITVDPEHDTPAQLAAYAKANGLNTQKDWVLLTGTREVIYQFARETLASEAFQKADPKGRDFVHSEHFYVIDQSGRLRGVLNGTRSEVSKDAEEMVSQL